MYIHITQPTYLRYESGERIPSLHVIKEIAEVFNTSVEYLTGETDSSDSNCIIIHKDVEPEIFQILQKRSEWDEKQLKRLLAYVEKFNELRSENTKSKKKTLEPLFQIYFMNKNISSQDVRIYVRISASFKSFGIISFIIIL